jgi:hypothetical protein
MEAKGSQVWLVCNTTSTDPAKRSEKLLVFEFEEVGLTGQRNRSYHGGKTVVRSYPYCHLLEGKKLNLRPNKILTA